jgi:hypothetical protein
MAAAVGEAKTDHNKARENVPSSVRAILQMMRRP